MKEIKWTGDNFNEVYSLCVEESRMPVAVLKMAGVNSLRLVITKNGRNLPIEVPCGGIICFMGGVFTRVILPDESNVIRSYIPQFPDKKVVTLKDCLERLEELNYSRFVDCSKLANNEIFKLLKEFAEKNNVEVFNNEKN